MGLRGFEPEPVCLQGSCSNSLGYSTAAICGVWQLSQLFLPLSALLSQVLDWALLGNSAACDPMVPSLALLLALSCAQFEFSFPAGQWELCQGRVAIQRPQGAGLSWGVWCRDSEPREHVTLQLGLEPTALTASLSQ